jgi:hypothetical protein
MYGQHLIFRLWQCPSFAAIDPTGNKKSRHQKYVKVSQSTHTCTHTHTHTHTQTHTQKHTDLNLVREFEEHAPVDNLTACRERVVRVERGVSHNHLKHNGTQGPGHVQEVCF